jgi:hypothetical protein
LTVIEFIVPRSFLTVPSSISMVSRDVHSEKHSSKAQVGLIAESF